MNRSNLKIKIVAIAILTLICVNIFAQGNAREEYIRKYYKWAILEMQKYGIPASITMAQGILESGNGTGFLATKANNHFGIKCHDWTGPSVRKDDDAKNECFRKYEHALQSYEDHSKFLAHRDRYSFLFDYRKTDYIAWSKGLRKAGYATDPKYPDKLITIIEDEQLYLLDEYALAKNPSFDELPSSITDNNDISYLPEVIKGATQVAIATHVAKQTAEKTTLQKKPVTKTTVAPSAISDKGLSYAVVGTETSYAEIAKKYGLHEWEIYKYNDINKSSGKKPTPGEHVYLEYKLSECKKIDIHRVRPGETLLSISNKYGIRLNSLCKINKMNKNTKILNGQTIYLNEKSYRKSN